MKQKRVFMERKALLQGDYLSYFERLGYRLESTVSYDRFDDAMNAAADVFEKAQAEGTPPKKACTRSMICYLGRRCRQAGIAGIAADVLELAGGLTVISLLINFGYVVFYALGTAVRRHTSVIDGFFRDFFMTLCDTQVSLVKILLVALAVGLFLMRPLKNLGLFLPKGKSLGSHEEIRTVLLSFLGMLMGATVLISVASGHVTLPVTGPGLRAEWGIPFAFAFSTLCLTASLVIRVLKVRRSDVVLLAKRHTAWELEDICSSLKSDSLRNGRSLYRQAFLDARSGGSRSKGSVYDCYVAAYVIVLVYLFIWAIRKTPGDAVVYLGILRLILPYLVIRGFSAFCNVREEQFAEAIFDGIEDTTEPDNESAQEQENAQEQEKP